MMGEEPPSPSRGRLHLRKSQITQRCRLQPLLLSFPCGPNSVAADLHSIVWPAGTAKVGCKKTNKPRIHNPTNWSYLVVVPEEIQPISMNVHFV